VEVLVSLLQAVKRHNRPAEAAKRIFFIKRIIWLRNEYKMPLILVS
jgi:hypothetical protein